MKWPVNSIIVVVVVGTDFNPILYYLVVGESKEHQNLDEYVEVIDDNGEIYDFFIGVNDTVHTPESAEYKTVLKEFKHFINRKISYTNPQKTKDFLDKDSGFNGRRDKSSPDNPSSCKIDRTYSSSDPA